MSATVSMFQPMPALTPDQFAALREDVAANGVLVPVVLDQHGRILDGNNRVRIAAELGIGYPSTTVKIADDEAALDLAVTLNCARRHLTREQQRDVIAAEAARRPGDSDRAIARRVGCSPSTVAAVRRPVSKLDTPDPITREDAAAITTTIRQTAAQSIAGLQDVVDLLLGAGADRPSILLALLEGNASELARWSFAGAEVLRTIQRYVHGPIVAWFLADDEDVPADLPLSDDVLSILLDQLAGRVPGWLADERLTRILTGALSPEDATVHGREQFDAAGVTE